MLQIKAVSGLRMFALRLNLCYSNKVEREQWSLPVAVWPAPCEGSGKRMEWNSFVGSDVMRCCTVKPL